MPRVLIIEDDLALRDFFVFDFETMGFQTFAACDGSEALRILNDQDVDVVVSDIQMPGLSGLDLTRQLRQRASDPSRPVIVLVTGHQEILPDEAYGLGVNGFLYKPFSRQELSKIVTTLLVPPTERWPSEEALLEAMKIEKCGDLEIKVSRWKQSSDQNILSIGRGGFFVSMSEAFPDLGTRIGFQITSDEPSEPMLSGMAVVRWVRRIAADELVPGVGFEILTLDLIGSSAMLAFINIEKPIPYIPRR